MLAIVGGPIFGGAKPVPFNPQMVRGGEWGSALVAIAGPLTNLVLAFILFGVFNSFGEGSSGLVQQIFVTAVMVNLGFFIFNMLPIPPLDGSRVVYALAPDFIRRGMEIIERFGIIVVFLIVLMLGPALGQIMVAAITFFLDLFSKAFIF
jgi:Zn-dependent protease